MPITPAKRVLALVGELIGLVELDEFCHGLMDALREAVPSDWAALNELPADLPRTISLTQPPVPVELHERFASLGLQNPIAAHFIRTVDGRATRFSDLFTRAELHQLDLYQQVYVHLGVEHQIAFTIPSLSSRLL